MQADLAPTLELVKPEFDVIRAFSLDEGSCGTRLNVSVTFAADDYSKPLSVSFSDPDRDQLVSVDFDLWARVVAAVARAADQ